ncbi:MAG TPA: PxKF domain-containing protein [Burkholderiales bacterium]|nr:PxKF domain-containing protein [Burkholderiales bacterium]
MVAERVQELGDFSPTLVVAGDGNVYGSMGRQLFKVDPAGRFHTVHSFAAAEGSVQLDALVIGNDGAVYGLTGGFQLVGGYSLPIDPAFFRLDLQGNVTKTVPHLPSYRLGFKMVKSSDGAFYASLRVRLAGEIKVFDGDVARITSSGAFTLVGGNRGEAIPEPMAIGSDGALYGSRDDTNYFFNELGGIIRWDVSGQATEIHPFANRDEAFPEGFTLAPDGLLYSTSPGGGTQGAGTIHALDTNGNLTLLHSFDNYTTEGASPTTLTVGSDGALYGMTYGQGSNGGGTVFRLSTNGALSTLFSFNSNVGGGALYPFVAARSGVLYGTGTYGTPAASVVRLTVPSTVETFPILPQGTWPVGPLLQGSDCALYGVAGEQSVNPYKIQYFLYRTFDSGQLCQRIDFAALPDRTLGEPPFELGASSSSTLPVSFSASGSCTVKDEQVTLAGGGVCTITASQPGDGRFGPADEVSQSFDVRFDFSGFLPPVTDPPAVNRVKAGRTVPIRFRLGGDAGRDVLAAGSRRVRPVDCNASAPVNDVAGGFWAGSNGLMHFPGTRTYTYLWKTEKSWAGTCQELSLELVDGSVHRAVFRFERPHGPALKVEAKH